MPPVRTRRVRSCRRAIGVVLVGAAGVAGLAGCGGDDATADLADERAEQIRSAAVEAGLDDEVADFLGLLGRGAVTEHEVTYPGPGGASTLVVRNRPPDRRIDVIAEGRVVEVRLTVDGAAYRCEPGPSAGGDVEAGDASEPEGIPAAIPLDDAECERTDAFVDGPGTFSASALDELTASLAERTEDFTFDLRTQPVAGIEATCLVVAIRDGRERSDLGDGGTICAADTGALVLVDQTEEALEATAHRAGVDDDAFTLPDGP